jgi:putative FmdB family regulatory protein
MPTYDYRCPKCKRVFELFHAITDDTPKRCPRCKTKSVRVPSAGAGLLFKGSGFYITDYRSKSYKEKAKQEGSSASKPAESSGGKSAESSGGKSAESSGGKSAESSGGKSAESSGGKPTRSGEKRGRSGSSGSKGE